jgi:predicted DNA-binding transcriptional regulator AlpA
VAPRETPNTQLSLLDHLPSSDGRVESSPPELGNAQADCAIGASAEPDRTPSNSDRAKPDPVPAKAKACINHEIAGLDGVANCPVDASEPPIPPSTGLAPRKRGRPPGSRNKQPESQLKPENVPGLTVNEAKASTAIADSGVRFLSDKDVALRYSLSRSSIWRLVAKGQFPRPYRLTNGATRWKIVDLDAYDDSLRTNSRTKALTDVSPADRAGQPSAKPSQRASDGGGNRQRRRR